MKIALLGSAPSSLRLAPYADSTWQMWACSPGTYPVIPRCDVFFELHRFEPGIIGKAETQKPWFTPEYILWMAKQSLVWMADKVPEIPNSRPLPWQALVEKYGSYFFTSSLAWMMAMAIEAILESRHQSCGPKLESLLVTDKDTIGLWGVDMAATEEYGYQRAGCQFFIQLARAMDIEVIVPPESDLLLPAPLYGISESDFQVIKLTARRDELTARLSQAQARAQQANNEMHFLQGAIDDLTYNLNTWTQKGDIFGTAFKHLFGSPPVVSDIETPPDTEMRPGDIRWVPPGSKGPELRLRAVGDEGTE